MAKNKKGVILNIASDLSVILKSEIFITKENSKVLNIINHYIQLLNME